MIPPRDRERMKRRSSDIAGPEISRPAPQKALTTYPCRNPDRSRGERELAPPGRERHAWLLVVEKPYEFKGRNCYFVIHNRNLHTCS